MAQEPEAAGVASREMPLREGSEGAAQGQRASLLGKTLHAHMPGEEAAGSRRQV